MRGFGDGKGCVSDEIDDRGDASPLRSPEAYDVPEYSWRSARSRTLNVGRPPAGIVVIEPNCVLA